MPTITIDGKKVEVPPRATILEAARRLGIDVPTLCFLEGFRPSTSCLVCTVKIRNTGKLVPACGTEAVDGLEVESETAEVHDVRKTALELLLSDHVGDCLAPCLFMCPAHMDVPLMLRQISEESLPEAIVTVKRDIALPAVLGRVCPKPCEKGCRRGGADGPVAVCQLKRYVADVDLSSDAPYLPERKPPSGKRVAVVGAGPTGLSAAYYLARDGHAVTVFDQRDRPGGRLREQIGEGEGQTPESVLEGEIDLILRLGVKLQSKTTVGEKPSLDDLVGEFDAVLIACGAGGKEQAERFGLKPSTRGIHINKETFETGRRGVFAAGNAVRTKGLVVRSVADGKEVAVSIGQFLARQSATGPQKAFSVRMGRVAGDELSEFLAAASEAPRRDAADPAAGFSPAEAVRQAGRCLHCDCRALETCKLKHYAATYGADPNRYRGERAAFEQFTQHSRVIYEPGKCIDCGLCIDIAAQAKEPLGLAFIGRGFEVRVGVPFNRSMEEALSRVAAECVAACPTAALSFKDNAASGLPILGQR
ncbi:MAG: FAD-dependent oxidoreductase [Planctomycetota bacterium]|jgi:NADPH-dependent glutamate synthase beta subunit-like oxidoreductase/ferredoxin